jgi:DNA-binding NtrC family response regulator
LPYELLRRWEAYEWPGNVRELQNEVARRAALGDLAAMDASVRQSPRATGDLVEEVLALDLPLIGARERIVAEFERRYIERVVDKHGGNVSQAAAASGLAHRYFQLLRARRRR